MLNQSMHGRATSGEAKMTANFASVIQHCLNRYGLLKHHSCSVTKDQLAAVQHWQRERFRKSHEVLIGDPQKSCAIDFLFSEVYGGVDLSTVVSDIQRAYPLALRVFSENVMRTAAVALELNTLTAELDEGLAYILFEKMNVGVIDAESYLQAFRTLGTIDLRMRQLALTEMLLENIDRYINSKVIFGAFKLAKGPARAAGLTHLYAFMDKGFCALKSLGSSSHFMKTILENERSFIHNVFNAIPDPYQLMGKVS